MKKNKGGRKPLGEDKRIHGFKLWFSSSELEQVKTIIESYNLDFKKRGVVGPFLRRLILNKETVQEDKLPDSFSNLIYQIHKIGVNINQLTKVANYKNMRSPSSNLEQEIKRSNELMSKILEALDMENI
ncbi:plasmid mobilization relaxosome protein MobC [Flagellimonas pacifica]|uniref:Mobilisation protein (MobC) n=1 Tax=Flagellimonas pacifica TaxID=1247520 RepID=A0A285MVT4_9FLAO|nr:plasmid mobilization relaxosome protein MobC [Allomuricauda parva]SNZ01312.1 mobilisation protein (MobC) [Allomuricauda parva]